MESFSEFCNMNMWERDRAVVPVKEEKVKVEKPKKEKKSTEIHIVDFSKYLE